MLTQIFILSTVARGFSTDALMDTFQAGKAPDSAEQQTAGTDDRRRGSVDQENTHCSLAWTQCHEFRQLDGHCRTAHGGIGTFKRHRGVSYRTCQEKCLHDHDCLAVEFQPLSAVKTWWNDAWGHPQSICELHTERITTRENLHDGTVCSIHKERCPTEQPANCCQAFTARCRACVKGMTVEELCYEYQYIPGCKLGEGFENSCNSGVTTCVAQYGYCRDAHGGMGTVRRIRGIEHLTCQMKCLDDHACVAIEYQPIEAVKKWWNYDWGHPQSICEIHTERITTTERKHPHDGTTCFFM